jgi:DNA-directed RNA polymerase specialized sigma24 family protein
MQETDMTAQRPEMAGEGFRWDRPRLRHAMATARHHAARGTRRSSLGSVDREDFAQDILLAILQRSRHFDPRRGTWATFVDLVARHAVADRARQERARVRPDFVPIAIDLFPSGASATQQDHTDPILSLDLARIADTLPAGPQAILRLLGAAGDVASVARASALSQAAFYRAIVDLRFWLHVAGVRPPRGAPSRRAHGRA